jgi:hypothetical protein
MSKGYFGRINFTQHFLNTVKAKGFTPEQIISAIRNPEKVTDVRRYPRQKRYCGAGVAVVMHGADAITVYLDGVVTPLREDQKSDPAALASKRLNR